MDNSRVYGAYALNAPKIMYHILKNTDLLRKFLDSSKDREFEFDSFCDFCSDEVMSDALGVEDYEAIGAYDEPFSFMVCEYQGLFFVRANEFDDTGFFIERKLAEECAEEMAEHYQ